MLQYASQIYAGTLVSICLDAYWYDNGLPTIKPALDNGEPVQGAAFAVRAENGGTYSIAEDFPELLQMNYKDNVRKPFDPFELNSAHVIKVKDEDAVRLAMVAQLIAGVSLYMTGSDEEQFPIKKIGKGHSWSRSRREPGPPSVRTFRMMRPVVHDFRQMVSDYCQGKSSKMTVQTHVTGHWKNQVYGKGRMLRKRLYIEPYWKGPMDAPIAQRAHVVA